MARFHVLKDRVLAYAGVLIMIGLPCCLVGVVYLCVVANPYST
ncbi:hypothetical protein [Streptomyces daliensis]